MTSEKNLSRAIVLLVLVVQAIAFAPELATAGYRNNDSVSHYALIRGMVDAVEHGGNPLDFWSAETSFGLAMARSYQPLAHLLVVGVYFALGKAVSLMTVFLWAKYLSMLLLPISFYVAALWLEFPPLVAAAAAFLAPLIGGPGPGQLGIELRSWMGFGVYPQAVGANLLLLSIGLSYRAIRTGKHLTPAGILIGLTMVAHLIYGWMAALTACLIAVIPDHVVARIPRIRRTAIIGIVAGVIAAFQLYPLVTDGYLINRSRLEPADKFDSFGAAKVLEWLFSGQIMDHERLPVLSLLALLGAGLLLWRYYKTHKLAPAEMLLLTGAAFWLLVFFGRPTWGGLLMLIGVTRDLPLHRVIAAVQLFLLLLAAIGLATLWRIVARRVHPAAAAALTLVLLAPMVVERAAFVETHTDQGRVTAAAVATEGHTLDEAIAAAKQRGGRVFAGLPGKWGTQFTLGRTPVYAFLMTSLTPGISSGYNVNALPSDLIPNFDQGKPFQYKLFNIRTVMAPKVSPPDFLQLIGDFGKYRVMAAPGEGYFGLVDVVAAAETTRDNFYSIADPWMRSDWPEKNQYIWMALKDGLPKDVPRVTAGYLPEMASPATPPGSVANERQDGQVYTADLDVQRPAWLLFRMTYHPLWKVLLDGQAVRTAMLSPGFVGAQVTAGRHHVESRYEPGKGKTVLAFAGFAIALLMLGVEYRRARRKQA
jgi:hypothetical protein